MGIKYIKVFINRLCRNPSVILGLDPGIHFFIYIYDTCPTILELKKLYGIDAVIDIRNCWNKNEQEKLLNPEIADNITYDYSGNVYCYCSESEVRRKMAFAGYEKKRDTLKFRCPADE